MINVTKNMFILLDQAVGLESYNRVSGTVAVELVEHAQESSYGESSRHVTGEAISRQTVMNRVRLLKDLKIEPAIGETQRKSTARGC